MTIRDNGHEYQELESRIIKYKVQNIGITNKIEDSVKKTQERIYKTVMTATTI